MSSTILDLQVKAGLTSASGPNLHNFVKAGKEESLLRVAEGGGVHVDEDVSLEESFHSQIFKMATISKI